MLPSSRGDVGQRPQALRRPKSDLISLQFIPLCLASTLALPFPKWHLSDRRGRRAPIWKMFHMLQATFKDRGSLCCHCP